MTSQVAILVLGDGGPSRDILLAREEIEIVWSTSPEEASERLQAQSIDACIATEDLAPPWFLSELHGRNVSAIVLGRHARVTELDSTDVVPVFVDEADPQGVLVALESLTSLRFAKHPRFPVALSARSKVGGTSVPVVITELSRSGAAITGLPEVAIGSSLPISTRLDLEFFEVQARVVRWFEREGERFGGVEFESVDAPAEHTLDAFLERAARDEMSHAAIDDALFSDIEFAVEDTAPGIDPLSTGDLDPFVPDLATPRADRSEASSEIQHLRRLVERESAALFPVA